MPDAAKLKRRNLMRRLLTTVVVLAVGAGCFVAGLVIGFKYRPAMLFGQRQKPKHAIRELQETQEVMSDLDEGKLDEAKEFLTLKLDNQIVSIDGLMQFGSLDRENREYGDNVLALIAIERKEFPHRIGDSEYDGAISNILERALLRYKSRPTTASPKDKKRSSD